MAINDPKQEDRKPAFGAGLTSGETSAASAPNASASKPQDTEHSVIGKNIKFRGELVGTESLHIEGTIEGTVIMEGHDLSIGEGGVLNANVHAKNVVINGKLTGDLLADELIKICNTATVKGNLIAPRIQLDDGGKFRGSMDMVDSDDEIKDRKNQFKDKLVHPHLPESATKPMETTKPAANSSPAPAQNKDSSKGNNPVKN